jgi:hypothetical protein
MAAARGPQEDQQAGQADEAERPSTVRAGSTSNQGEQRRHHRGDASDEDGTGKGPQLSDADRLLGESGCGQDQPRDHDVNGAVPPDEPAGQRASQAWPGRRRLPAPGPPPARAGWRSTAASAQQPADHQNDQRRDQRRSVPTDLGRRAVPELRSRHAFTPRDHGGRSSAIVGSWRRTRHRQDRRRTAPNSQTTDKDGLGHLKPLASTFFTQLHVPPPNTTRQQPRASP